MGTKVWATRREVLNFRIENCGKYLEYWATVPSENVNEGLDIWRSFLWKYTKGYPMDCKSIACAGGWLPAMDHFRNLGVYSTDSGAPVMGFKDLEKLPVPQLTFLEISNSRWGRGEVEPFDLSHVLFGSNSLFIPRWEPLSEGSDKKVVEYRFRRQLKELQIKKEVMDARSNSAY